METGKYRVQIRDIGGGDDIDDNRQRTDLGNETENSRVILQTNTIKNGGLPIHLQLGKLIGI